jgi:hypothetical protein
MMISDQPSGACAPAQACEALHAWVPHRWKTCCASEAAGVAAQRTRRAAQRGRTAAGRDAAAAAAARCMAPVRTLRA